MPRFTARRALSDEVARNGAGGLHHSTLVSVPSPDRARPDTVNLRLCASAEPSSLAVVRHAVGGLASALGLGPAGVADVRLALTEAVTAAIRRSAGYNGADGAIIEVRAWLEDDNFHVAVRDAGADATGRSIPLPLVAAISDAVELTRLPDGGTEVAMTFATGG